MQLGSAHTYRITQSLYFPCSFNDDLWVITAPLNDDRSPQSQLILAELEITQMEIEVSLVIEQFLWRQHLAAECSLAMLRVCGREVGKIGSINHWCCDQRQGVRERERCHVFAACPPGACTTSSCIARLKFHIWGLLCT